MPIIAYLGSSINDYRQTAPQKLMALDIRCPKHPEAQMKAHDQYERGIKESGERIWIQRLICPECRKTTAILPDFVRPYKQYSANEIEEVLIAAETTSVYDIETSASVYTVRRWLKTERSKAERSVSLLKALAYDTGTLILSEIELLGLDLIEQIKCITSCFPKVKHSGNMLGLADILTANRYIHIAPG
jgi:hypothetical protein